VEIEENELEKESSGCPAPIGLKLVDGSVCRNLPVGSAKTRRNHVIDWTDDVNCGAEGAVRVVALLASQIGLRSPASVPAPNWMVTTY